MRKGSNLWREEKLKDIEKFIQETTPAERRKIKEQFDWKGEGKTNIPMKRDKSELMIKENDWCRETDIKTMYNLLLHV